MSSAGKGNEGSGGQTMAEKNAEHFNQVTPDQWPQWVLDLHHQIEGFLTSPECPSWLGLPAPESDSRMLDYACGDGMIARALLPYFARIVGVDVSTTMLDKFRATATRLGLGPDRMVGICADLLAHDLDDADDDKETKEGGEILRDFDLIATSMALHHFEQPGVSLQRLAARLKVGGTLLVIDWAPLDGSTRAQREYYVELRGKGIDPDDVLKAFHSHAASHTIAKPNFTEKEMEELFEASGCNDFRWKLAEELSPIPVIPNGKAQLFWARATRI